MKVFGYKTKDVKKLYLNGNAIIITLGALIEIPLSKMFMDKVFPSVHSKRNKRNKPCIPMVCLRYNFCRSNGNILFIITSILVRKLGKITPAEVLKNRE